MGKSTTAQLFAAHGAVPA
ncbi:MAG: hypothetical protein P0Y66_03085 [Candidatus Kaistia colombiensis]|nr:MAG: hypothetical protein P0Y66_03085 [Kaistia sp.]